MKLLGHPIHVMLVHFPIALFIMGFVFSLLGKQTEEESLTMAGYYALCSGVLIGLVAGLFGAIDLIGVYKNKRHAFTTGLLHASLNLVVVIVFGVIVYMSYQDYPNIGTASNSLLLVEALTLILMLVGNYLGAHLIFKYKVGVFNE